MSEIKTLKLSKPFKISTMDNDREIKELPYDFENLTARDKLNASKKMKTAGIPCGAFEEIDSDYHLFLFAEAVTKADSSIDTSDVMRISAKDAGVAAFLTRSFFFLGSAE
jgi:hypothetical protein